MATKYTLTKDEFTAITETSGTIQNVGTEVVELVSTSNETEGEGILLAPHEKRTFNGALSARSVGDAGAAVNVVDFIEAGKGGGGGSEYVLPVATASRLGGVKSSTTSGNIKVNSDGTMTYNAPDVDPISAPEWETGTAYPVNALVEYDVNVYLCLTAHTSGVFADDLAKVKWKLVSMTLQTATSSTLGGVKSSSAFGKISVNSDGTMSMNGNPNDGTPTGTVISFFGITPPTGYLTCDGTAYNIADYQALADHINTQFGSYNYFGGDGTTTFAVPDLRGEFLRGTGTNSHTNQGSGASVGAHQDGTTHLNIASSNEYLYLQVNTRTGSSYETAFNKDSLENASGSYHNMSLPAGTSATAAVTYTSRPTNTSVLYCIKC